MVMRSQQPKHLRCLQLAEELEENVSQDSRRFALCCPSDRTKPRVGAAQPPSNRDCGPQAASFIK